MNLREPRGLARLVESPEEIRRVVQAARRSGLRVGFVPTMGALHAGHRSLIEQARRDCDVVVVSIFVNPTQFAPHEDLSKYPRPLEADLGLCAGAGADLVFHPSVAAMYPAGMSTIVRVEGLTAGLEGSSRPTHFQGVTTVVLKLFSLVPADVAYFGQKDFQQQAVLRKMTADLCLLIEIEVCPTVREPDGLALSSRNVYLSPTERRQALELSATLREAIGQLERGSRDIPALQRAMRERLERAPGVVLDYATLADPQTLAELQSWQPNVVALVAARVGSTRLIDNMVFGHGA
ncbi:MAG: pantoate--beta-alanine ligase [Planctomycetaceae bacterium]